MNSTDLLARLVAHPTISRTPNLDLIEMVRGMLEAAGARTRLVPYEEGRTNLLASAGPEGPGGVLLSGHVDVVPVEGQDWTVPPFEMTRADGRLYGRGTTDMKGFVACAVTAMIGAATRDLARPLHLAISCDEEVGCLGVRPLIEMLKDAPRPDLIVVGEPTSMAVATGHKGKIGMRSTLTGREGHSSRAPEAVNALHMAADLMSRIRAVQAELAGAGARDAAYDVPYTTLHAGVLTGGTALNIVPSRAAMDWEIRFLAEDDAGAILARLEEEAQAIAAATGAPEASVETVRTIDYPGLAAPEGEAVRFAKALAGVRETVKVAYGTEGGLFAEGLGVPTVICGPGDMAQGHRPDEFVAEAQIAACDAMLARLVGALS